MPFHDVSRCGPPMHISAGARCLRWQIPFPRIGFICSLTAKQCMKSRRVLGVAQPKCKMLIANAA